MTCTIDTNYLANLTLEYGGNWGLDHTKRLLHWVEILGEGLDYDKEIVAIAAYLHDWGGYAKYILDGVDHAVRSKQVVAEFLAEKGYPKDKSDRVLECIEFHHGGDPKRSIESILLTDADALDMLGVVGTLRVFAMCPRDIRTGYHAVKKWRDTSIAAITLDKSKEIAQKRVAETNQLLQMFEEETFGLF